MVVYSDDDAATEPVSITCIRGPAMIRVTVREERSGAENSFDVERTDLTTMLMDHLLAPELELEVLSGVRDFETYRHAMFTALHTIAMCGNSQ